jgi:hypothetical protein
MMTLNSIGDVLSDDKLTLKEAGVTSFQRLFTEVADSAPEGEVNVRFIFGENRSTKKIDRMFHAVVKLDWKIRDVVQRSFSPYFFVACHSGSLLIQILWSSFLPLPRLLLLA